VSACSGSRHHAAWTWYPSPAAALDHFSDVVTKNSSMALCVASGGSLPALPRQFIVRLYY